MVWSPVGSCESHQHKMSLFWRVTWELIHLVAVTNGQLWLGCDGRNQLQDNNLTEYLLNLIYDFFLAKTHTLRYCVIWDLRNRLKESGCVYVWVVRMKNRWEHFSVHPEVPISLLPNDWVRFLNVQSLACFYTAHGISYPLFSGFLWSGSPTNTIFLLDVK